LEAACVTYFRVNHIVTRTTVRWCKFGGLTLRGPRARVVLRRYPRQRDRPERTDEVIRRHIQGNLSDGSVFSGDMTSGTSTPVHDDKTPREDYLRWSNGGGGYRHSWIRVRRSRSLTWSIVGITRGTRGSFFLSRSSVRFRQRLSM
jgi:hypothetical protein